VGFVPDVVVDIPLFFVGFCRILRGPKEQPSGVEFQKTLVGTFVGQMLVTWYQKSSESPLRTYPL
jgi:hypothetical protein